MTLLEAIFLAIVQGLTEFLPVSSSGHLAIFQNVFKIEEADMLFDVLLHLGTLIAIFICYWKDIKKLIVNGFAILGLWIANAGIFIANIFSKEKKPMKKVITSSYRKFVIMVIISTIPTGIIGVLGEKLIGEAGKQLLVPGICLIITSAILFVSDRLPVGEKTPKSTTYGDAVKVGIVQGLATLPGISRSGSTITAGLACGFTKSFAVKYSFIMSIPAVLGAVVLELKDGLPEVADGVLTNYLIGTVVSGVVGFFCIKVVLKLINNNKFKYFSYYCLLAGIASIVGYFVIK